MTRAEIVDVLKGALQGELDSLADLDVVDDGPDGSLVIEAGGERYSVDIRRIGPSTLDSLPGKLRDDETLEEQLARLEQMLEYGEASAEEHGPVPPEELHRMVEKAKASGLRRRDLQLRKEARRRHAS